jgi:hypothetical protein
MHVGKDEDQQYPHDGQAGKRLEIHLPLSLSFVHPLPSLMGASHEHIKERHLAHHLFGQ